MYSAAKRLTGIVLWARSTVCGVPNGADGGTLGTEKGEKCT